MSSATLDVVTETKPSRKRQNARATARPVAQKTRVTLVIDEDAARRLGIYSVMVGRDRSDIVSELIRDNLKRFRVQDLDPSSARDTGEDRQASPAA